MRDRMKVNSEQLVLKNVIFPSSLLEVRDCTPLSEPVNQEREKPGNKDTDSNTEKRQKEYWGDSWEK